MIPQKTKCFVIIVHYGADIVTRRCLAALCQSEKFPDLIIIVDQAAIPLMSTVNEQEYCRIIRPPRNNGYGAGLNAGLRALKAQGVQANDIVVCMNNDVVVTSRTIALVDTWWQRQSPGVLAGPVVRTINMFTGRAGESSASFFSRLPIFVPYIDGAFVAGAWSTWSLLAGWPEDYFMYYEDALLSRRARRLNITLRKIPALPLTHAAYNTALSLDKLYYLVRNGALFLEQASPGIWPLYWKLVNRVRLILHSLLPASPRRRVVRQALRDARDNSTGHRPSSA